MKPRSQIDLFSENGYQWPNAKGHEILVRYNIRMSEMDGNQIVFTAPDRSRADTPPVITAAVHDAFAYELTKELYRLFPKLPKNFFRVEFEREEPEETE